MLIVLLQPLEAIGQRKLLDKTLSISVREQKIGNVLDEISSKTDIYFSYNSDLIQDNQRFTLHAEDESLKHILTKLFVGTKLSFKLIDRQVIIFRNDKKYEVENVNIFGKVVDSSTGEPVRAANVFVAGTLKGSSTNSEGDFSIKDMILGTYELVVSHIAYDIKVSRVSISGAQKSITVNVEIQPKVHTLDEIEVTSGRDKEWEANMKVFKQEFLGKTQNASKCEIVNPESIDFLYDKKNNALIAKSSEPIVVVNDALGYELQYVLEYFEIKEGKSQILGVSKFKELEPKRRKEKKRWTKNRRKSYRGSLMHFLRALVNDDLNKQGFRVFTIEDLPVFNEINITRVNVNSLVVKNRENLEKELTFSNYLKVEYVNETESSDYIEDQVRLAVINENKYLLNFYRSALRAEKRKKGQTSYIKLNFPVVTINPKGFINEPLAITTYGYWSWERVAEYLPFEYELK